MRRFRLPRRHHFRRDAYVVYADVHNDVMFACVSLYECLQQQYGVRLLLRDREELPGSVRAESIVQHIDDSWKVLHTHARTHARERARTHARTHAHTHTNNNLEPE